MTSPVRLTVSPAAASTPTGVFNQRFEALFPLRWSPGLCGLLHSPAVPPSLSMCECGAVGCYLPLCLPHSPPLYESGPLCLSVHEYRAAGSASGQTARPVRPTLRQSRSRVLSAPPTGLDERFFFISFVVGLPCR